ncbi:MAG: tetratricopeptide repeat protein [Gemmatimonadetes bacterium]|nr:tetratricopeptide repeat protein [Gemmatimonadota bacterium]NIR81232.1 tetratricopeptide repeat protein [Gemmatimonadota bacterium]NIT90077.1 tetratricopeptide repeat protein [Gemmatimonadota bacterium]NIU33889.1 tetratricopeptide repeat protein [Gemmatimonadota bacterium]NIU38081.1 tetratricopeptide repeat protein [Gemmatimonadota bacterium]
MSPRGDQEYFSDGLAEELLNALARVPGLRVPARTSSFAFKERKGNLREIGRTLNVEAVLEGSVRKQDDQLRITAQLIELESGFHLWSATFDGDMEDVFALQEEIARSVARLLETGSAEAAPPRAGSAAGSPSRTPTGHIEAYDLYLRGRYALNQRTQASLSEALSYFRHALELDSAYAEAHAGLAATHNLRALNQYVRPEEGYGPGLAAARRALELDETVVDGHAALAMALYLYAWDWEGAEAAFLRALELDSNNARTRYFHSMYLSALRENESAILEARHAARLDPLSPPVNMGVGMAYFHADRLPEAVAEFRRTIADAPDYFFPYSWLGLAEVQLGNAEAAVEAARRGVALNPGSPLTGAMLAEVLARAGQGEEAREILAGLDARAGTEPVSGTYVARAWIALGEGERALDWLERAVRWREGQVIQIRGPGYDPIRLEPRFRRLLDTLAFPGS